MNPPYGDLSESFQLEMAEMEQRFLQVNEASKRAQSCANLAALLELVADELFSLPNVDGCSINLVQESAQALATAYLRLPSEFSGVLKTYQGFLYRLDESDVNAQVFKSGKSELVCRENLEQHAEATRMRFERWQMCSLLVLLITVQFKDGNVRPIGTAMVFSSDHLFEPEFEAQVKAIIDSYAPLIQIHWNYQQAVERGKTVEAMYAKIQQFIGYMARMNRLTAPDAVYEAIGTEFMHRFRFDMVNILMAENGELAMVHTAFSKPFKHVAERWEPFRKTTRYSLNAQDGQSALIFLSNQRFMIDDVAKVLHLPMAEKDKRALAIMETTRTFVMVPIRHNDEPIGVMWFCTLGGLISLTESDLTLIDMLSAFIGTAIRNAQAHLLVEQQSKTIELLNQDLQQKMILLDQVARRDRLTGLNNFGNFEEELVRRTSEFTRIEPSGALSLILLDIDHFKEFNDTYGHLAGNQVLQEVGARMLECVRDMDFAARYGGEEFVALLPQCDLSGAIAIAERIRSRISEEPFAIDGKSLAVTISGGCAQFLPPESPHDFVGRVDANLYAAKRKGRNCIEAAPGPIDVAPEDKS